MGTATGATADAGDDAAGSGYARATRVLSLRLPPPVWMIASALAAWALGVVSLHVGLAGLRWRGLDPASIATFRLGAMGLLSLALLLATMFRIAILDALLQLNYRENFAVWFGQFMLFAGPLLFVGRPWLVPGLAILVLLQALQWVRDSSTGKYLALCAALTAAGFWEKRQPHQTELALAWCGFAAALTLLARVRFLAEAYEEAEIHPDARIGLRGLASAVCAPLLLALALVTALPAPRRIYSAFSTAAPAALGGGRTLKADDIQALLWQGAGLAVVVAVAIGALHGWGLVRARKRAAVAPPAEEIIASKTVDVEPEPPSPDLDPLRAGDPRTRILRRAREWQSLLAARGHRREPQITIREYLEWLLHRYPADQQESQVDRLRLVGRLFEKARYRREEISEADAATFDHATSEALSMMPVAPRLSRGSGPGGGAEATNGGGSSETTT